MKSRAFLPLLTALFFASSFLSCLQPGRQLAGNIDSLVSQLDRQRVMLPNGWSLSPAGKRMPLGDLPLNLVVSPKGDLMAVTNNGQSKQSIILVDPVTEKILDEKTIRKSWYGLVFSGDGTRLYASGGNDNMIVVYNTSNRTLVKSDSIILGKPWPVRISPTGLALDDDAHTLYIATKEDSALYVADVNTKTFKRIALGHEAYACLLSPDRKTLYISLWGGDQVAVFDPGSQKVVSTIAVGSNPNDMAISRNGKYLFVAHANDNGVSVISTADRKVIEVFTSSVIPESLAGSTPNALALSEDEKKLYIANADNNCLAVFDVSEPGDGKSLGFIPTDWYPTSVKVWNDRIWIANGKGSKSLPNPKGPNPYERRTDSTQYIAGLFKGSLTIVPEPDEETLRAYTHAVFRNTPYTKQAQEVAEGEEGNPIPRKKGDPSPVKYVFYVVKENRTYDQMFGDIKEGNGDSSLCLFPENVTPNHHALAREFVLLDNFYVNAEVSADGHNWSMAAYANDYVEKTWPTNYGGRGGTYDYEGTREIAYPKDGFIWDYCARAGVSYRSYGEFVDGGKATLTSLEGHYDPDFPEFNLHISDLVRLEKWRHDFDSLVAIHALPHFSTIRLPNDHTAGAQRGMPTPRAMVAENDLALGQLVEHITKSPVWKESAIFVLEDDAQAGPDHVDAHRSIALVISPYAKRKTKVSEMYSTASLLRTMELILGLPPMSQYDAAATPMWRCFKREADNAVYHALPATYDLGEMNKGRTSLTERSAKFNFAVMDAVPDNEFSEVIWKAVKGIDAVMPAPVRSAFITPRAEEEDEDD